MSESDGRGGHRRRCLITFLYQAIPWVMFTAVFLVGLFVDLVLKKISEQTQRYFFYAYLITLGLLAVMLVIGTVLCCKNVQGKVNFILLIAFYIIFIAYAVTFEFALFIQDQKVVILCIGLPFLILSLGHLLYSLLCKDSPTNSVVSGCLVVLSALVPATCILIKYNNNMNFAAFLAAVLTLAQALISSSWMSAVRHSLGLE